MATITKTQNQMFSSNPMLKSFKKAAAIPDAKHATYQGVARKCGFFALFILAGVLLVPFLHSLNFEVIGHMNDYQINGVEGMTFIGSLLTFIIAPLLAAFIRPLTPVFGSIFCVAVGYFLGFSSYAIPDYGPLVMLAAILTAAIFLGLLFAYSRGAIKVTNRLRTVFTTAIFGVVFGSLLIYVASFIPATREAAMFITTNPLLGILGSIFYIILGSVYLVICFDNVRIGVEQGAAKKSEWLGAFSIVFGVVWLFMEILSLLNKLKK